jgi:NCAIR mutase (PurE)-related protein
MKPKIAKEPHQYYDIVSEEELEKREKKLDKLLSDISDPDTASEKKTGCFGIIFNDGVDEEDMKIRIAKFYQDNKKEIKHAWFYQFVGLAPIQKVHDMIKGMSRPKVKETRYNNREEIKNLVEYCLQKKESEDENVKELIDRLDIEFRNAWRFYYEKYKKKAQL